MLELVLLIGVPLFVGLFMYISFKTIDYRIDARRYREALLEERSEILKTSVHDLARRYQYSGYFNYVISKGPPKKPLWLQWLR